MRIRSQRSEIPNWIAALPVEIQIIGSVLVVGLFIAGNIMSHAPFLDGVGQQLASGGGTISAGFTAFFIYWTFGRKAVAAQRRSIGRQAGNLSPENEILLGEGGRANLGQVNRLGVLAHLAHISDHDPTFSVPVFHDLCRVLFRRAVAAESDADWDALRPFIAPVAQNSMKGILKRKRHPQCHVGRVHILDVEQQSKWVFFRVRIHALICDQAGLWRFLDMTWDMRRGTAARSMTPMDVDNLGCPACGSPIELTHPAGVCAICETAIAHGELSWQVTDVGWRPDETLRPDGLGPDSGGDDPSLQPMTPLDPHLAGNLRGLGMRHDGFELADLEERIVDTAKAMHAALDAHDISVLEPFATDGMVETTALRIQRWNAANLRWKRTDVEIVEVEAVRAFRDGWHEIVDVRIEQRLFSAIVDEQGNRIAGSLTDQRHSSIYLSFSFPMSNAPYDLTQWKLWRTVRPVEFAQ